MFRCWKHRSSLFQQLVLWQHCYGSAQTWSSSELSASVQRNLQEPPHDLTRQHLICQKDKHSQLDKKHMIHKFRRWRGSQEEHRRSTAGARRGNRRNTAGTQQEHSRSTGGHGGRTQDDLQAISRTVMCVFPLTDSHSLLLWSFRVLYFTAHIHQILFLMMKQLIQQTEAWRRVRPWHQPSTSIRTKLDPPGRDCGWFICFSNIFRTMYNV